jgi:hypothetical protein
MVGMGTSEMGQVLRVLWVLRKRRKSDIPPETSVLLQSRTFGQLNVKIAMSSLPAKRAEANTNMAVRQWKQEGAKIALRAKRRDHRVRERCDHGLTRGGLSRDAKGDANAKREKNGALEGKAASEMASFASNPSDFLGART